MIELNIRKKQLKKECCKLQREKDMLTEQLIKIKYESKSHNLSLCNHAIKQHNVSINIYLIYILIYIKLVLIK